ncbi:hypothetical protein J2Z20_003646, partial [Paenibacillus sediminis]|nr:hypothetical protein [Paenibacillus sediminis]
STQYYFLFSYFTCYKMWFLSLIIVADISYNVVVFTTPHHLKVPKEPAAMRLGGAGVSG